MEFRILPTYIYVSDANLPVEAQRIINSMTGNTNFATPKPALADVQAALDEFAKSIPLARDGGTKEVGDKNQKRERLESLLREEAAYVIGESRNDPAIIASSGFVVSKTRVRRVLDTLSITSGTESGQAVSAMWRVPKVRMYVHQYTTAPNTENSVWTEVYSPDRRYVHTGLVPGQRYTFRSKAITKQGQVITTDLVEWVVQ
jgi:hypothetical protein